MKGKNLFRGLVEKVLLGTVFAITPSHIHRSLESTALAQQVIIIDNLDQEKMNQAMTHMAVSSMLGVVANNVDYKDGTLLRGLAQLNRDMAWINASQARNTKVVIINNNRNDQNETSRTFLAYDASDKNNDSNLSWSEFDALDRNIFCSEQIMIAGIYLNQKDRKSFNRGMVKIYSPLGKEIHSKDLNFNLPYNEWRWSNLSPQKMFEYYGPGSYVATFYIGGKFWEARKFVIHKHGEQARESSFRTFICNFWRDMDGNNSAVDSEFIGQNKSQYRRNEKMISVIHAVGSRDREAEMKVINPRGEQYASYKRIIEKDNLYMPMNIDLRNDFNIHGPGTYTVSFHIDNRFFEARSFELTE
ncbi:MAG: hypothetical protein Q8N99_07990 [Nanoarchaeota archaeon]|nr:hypothetical protein [Nanoarchaeota archaeon]